MFPKLELLKANTYLGTNVPNTWASAVLMNYPCNYKNYLYKIWKKYPKNDKLKMQFLDYNKILKKVLNYAKEQNIRKEYYKKLTNNFKNNKQLWKFINMNINSKRCTVKSNISYITDNNLKIYDNKRIANNLIIFILVLLQLLLRFLLLKKAIT